MEGFGEGGEGGGGIEGDFLGGGGGVENWECEKGVVDY